jgi:6-phosphogluconolactonase
MANSTVELKRYATASALAAEVASEVAAHLAHALAVRGHAGLLVSGGHSPASLFEQLRTQVLDWNQVSIALVDERWVEPTDPGSNERFLRETLLRDHAAAARFVGLKNPAPSPDLGAAAAWNASARVPRPADVTVLGMGDDGHTASLIPGSTNLKSALDPEAAEGYVGTWSPSAPHARLSLNLRALLNSRRILIFLLGEAKLRTYGAACRPGPVEEMPVRGRRALLRRQRPGLIPTISRNRLLRCAWSANPQASATSASGSLVELINALARSTRRTTTYSIGENPRLRLKAREK